MPMRGSCAIKNREEAFVKKRRPGSFRIRGARGVRGRRGVWQGVRLERRGRVDGDGISARGDRGAFVGDGVRGSTAGGLRPG